MEQLRAALTAPGTVVLAGPPGCGKHRMAMQVARDLKLAPTVIDIEDVLDAGGVARLMSTMQPGNLNGDTALLIINGAELCSGSSWKAWTQDTLRIVVVVNDTTPEMRKAGGVIYMNRLPAHVISASIHREFPSLDADGVARCANGDMRFARNAAWVALEMPPHAADHTPHAMFDAGAWLRGQTAAAAGPCRCLGWSATCWMPRTDLQAASAFYENMVAVDCFTECELDIQDYMVKASIKLARTDNTFRKLKPPDQPTRAKKLRDIAWMPSRTCWPPGARSARRR